MLDIVITISPIIPIASLKASEVKTAPSAAVLPYKYKCEDIITSPVNKHIIKVLNTSNTPYIPCFTGLLVLLVA